MKNIFINCYDKDGHQLLGSNYSFYIDGRKNLETLKIELEPLILKKQEKNNCCKFLSNRIYNIKIFQGERFNESRLLLII